MSFLFYYPYSNAFNIFDAMNVLWLASWYPNRVEPFNGDFIERHAKAVAPFVSRLTVISAVKDVGLADHTSEIVKQQQGNITTYLIYYGRSHAVPAFEKILSHQKFMRLHRQVYLEIVKETGRPDIVHVHVAMKAGLFARELKRTHGIPYVVTEQWTGYFKAAKPNIYSMGFIFRLLTKSVLKNASLLLPVSNYLGEIINKEIAAVPYKAVPNVVDTDTFFPVPIQQNDVLQLVHVSIMGYQKNMDAMIEALQLYKKRGGKFLLQVFGPPPATVIDLVKQKDLDQEIIFKGEVTQSLLAPAVQAADALLLYSRYETFGCVLVEANASGTPVIVSDFPVFHEFIREDENGVFAENNNAEALSSVIERFHQHRNNFDRQKIAQTANKKFCFDTVGKMIKEIYEKYAPG